MVLAFQPGGPGSTPVRTLYFFHAFVHLFLCYGLCSKMGSVGKQQLAAKEYFAEHWLKKLQESVDRCIGL